MNRKNPKAQEGVDPLFPSVWWANHGALLFCIMHHTTFPTRVQNLLKDGRISHFACEMIPRPKYFSNKLILKYYIFLS